MVDSDRRATFPGRHYGEPSAPLWMSTLSYYGLVAVAAIAFFLVVWDLLSDKAADLPVLSAGVGTGILVAGAAIFREVILRSRRKHFLKQQAQRMAHSERKDPIQTEVNTNGKLTVEKNASLIAEIKKRSDAANVLNKLSDAHREVFELCAAYLNLIEDELKRMNPGSPRLEPFLKGRTRVADAHRFHMLRWAEIEATDSTLRAQQGNDVESRRRAARQALDVVETALTAYPNERSLSESRTILNELVVSIDVRAYVTEAEEASGRRDYKTAKRAYRDALYCLGRDSIKNTERGLAAERINLELEKIRFADRNSHS